MQKESGSSQIKQFFSAFLAKCRNIKYTIQGICDKIKKAAENAAYYKGILESALFKETFALCKKQLAFLWKHCKPKKLRLFVCVGTSDPALLGNIISLYGMLYPFVVNHVMLQPEFDKEILEGSLFTKGHITVFWLLKTAWILYFNKNIKRLRKLFQKEEV